MTKRFYLIFTLLIAVCSCNLSNIRAQEIVVDSLRFSLNGGTLTVVGAIDNIETAIIPNKVQNYTVTSIDNYAFREQKNLKYLVIPSTITSIGNQSFYKCTALESVSIPSSVTKIGNRAFYGCNKLSGITICSSTPATLGTEVFSSVGGCVIYLPAGSRNRYTTTNNWKTYNSQYVEISNGVNFYYDAVRYRVRSANEVSVEGSNLREVILPEKVLSYNVTSVSSEAFQYSALKKVVLSSTIKSIGDYSFAYCNNLSTIILKEGLETTGRYSIYNTGRYANEDGNVFSSIEIPATVTLLDYVTFRYCTALQEVIVPTMTPCAMGDGVFSKLNNNELRIYVPYGAIENFRLAQGWSEYLASVRSFYTGMRFTSSAMRYEVLSAEDNTLMLCSSEASKLSDQMTIPSDVLGYSVTAIGDSAFKECTHFKKITIHSAKPILLAENALDETNDCPIYVPYGSVEAYKSAPGWKKYADRIVGLIFNSSNNEFLYQGIRYRITSSTQNTVSVIGAEINYIDIPAEAMGYRVTAIADRAFANTSSIYTVSIGSNVTSIGSSAFENCTNLTSVTLSKGIQTISTRAFYRCTSLTNVFLPPTVTAIGASAFQYCTALEDITVNNSTPSTLGDSAFFDTRECPIFVPIGTLTAFKSHAYWSAYSHRLKELSGEGREFVYNGIYYMITSDENREVTVIGAEDLTDINIPATVMGYTVTSISDFAFEFRSDIETLILPSSLKEIGVGAFMECYSLTSLEIPESITQIGREAFSYCESLEQISIWSKTVSNVGVNAFVQTGDCPFFIHYSSYKEHLVANGWKDYADRMTPMLDRDGTMLYEGVLYSRVSDEDNEHLYVRSASSSLANVVIYDRLLDYYTIDSIAPKALLAHPCLSIEMAEGITRIGETAFAQCPRLREVTLSDRLTEISRMAFFGCSSLSSITIPESVTRIGEAAFSLCSSITDITLHSEINSIGADAFANCGRLSNVRVERETPISINSRAFLNSYSAKLYVPINSVARYATAPVWKNFSVIACTKNIGSLGYATLFADYDIIIPNGVTAYYGKYYPDLQLLSLIPIDGVIPARTAVILAGENGSYDLARSATPATNIEDNALSGVLTDTPVSAYTGFIYTLALGSQDVGFYRYVGETLGANKAFFELASRISVTWAKGIETYGTIKGGDAIHVLDAPLSVGSELSLWTRTLFNQTMTYMQPNLASAKTDPSIMVDYKVVVAPGYDFKPISVTYDCAKIGTDAGHYYYGHTIDGVEKGVVSMPNYFVLRNDNSNAEEASLSHEHDLRNVETADETFSFRIYVNTSTNKQLAIARVVLNGYLMSEAADPEAVPAIRIRIGERNEQVNGIENLTTEDKMYQDSPIYDLEGRKHKDVHTPGLYIRNGKRVMVK